MRFTYNSLFPTKRTKITRHVTAVGAPPLPGSAAPTGEHTALPKPLAVKGSVSQQKRKGRVDRAGEKGRGGKRRRRMEPGEGIERKGRRWTSPPLARIPAGAHATRYSTRYFHFSN